MSSPFIVESQPDINSDKDGCFWCGIQCPLENVCSLCSDGIHFCSPDHLKNHYYVVARPKESNNNNNERQCLPYRIGFGPELGRFAVATRDIDPTELVMADWPMVVGPSRQQKVVCVECLNPVDGNVRCPDCNFPLCSLKCVSTDFVDSDVNIDKKCDKECDSIVDELGHNLKWHRRFECRLLSENGFKAADRNEKCRSSAATEVPLLLVQIASLAPYRLLLKGLRQEKGSQDLVCSPLYNFCAPQQLTLKIYAFEEDVVDVIWNDFGVKNQLKDVNIVRQAIGQLFNNAKSLEKAGHDGTGLFGLYSVINHSCISNAKCIVGPAGRGYPIEVRAQVRIGAGEEITTRYVGVNIGAPMRADMLKEHWMFVCKCRRCLDPTDGGTYASAIRCPKCKQRRGGGQGDDEADFGFLLPAGKAGASSSEWECSACHWVAEKSYVEKVIDYGLSYIRRSNSTLLDADRLLELIGNLKKIFHPKHYLILQMKFVLMCVLRNSRDGAAGSESCNQSLVDLCQDLLSSLDVLDPGASRNRGKILKDLIPSYMRLAQSQHGRALIDDKEFELRKSQSSEYAKDLISCFKYEFL